MNTPLSQQFNQLINQLFTVKVFATHEEIEKTKKIIEEFQNGVGKQLQEKLVEKAKGSRNWLETWWENAAYLQNRSPMGVMGNMIAHGQINYSFWPVGEGTQLKRAAQSIYGYSKYFLAHRSEKIPILRDRKGTVTSMNQNKRIFCTSRIPGDPKDTIVSYFKTESEGPCPTHIAVFCNGHIFKMEILDKNGNQIGSREIQRQLTYIKSQSKIKGQGIGILTGDDRKSWAKAHQHLASLDEQNAENLETIQSCIIAAYLDNECIKDIRDGYRVSMSGKNAHDRWFDKATAVAYFENGGIGCIGDHCPYDGFVAAIMERWVDNVIITSKTDWLGTPNVQSDEIKPEEIIFTLDDMIEEAKVHAAETYKKNAARIDPCPGFFTLFGRNFPKEQRIHPDIFFQLAIQLAYYTKYGKPAPCYETATTRSFYHGRTETVRSTTQEAVNWCKAMNNKDVTVNEKMNLLRTATFKQGLLGSDALQAKGIDRHLLGLYLTSMEMGIDTPDIFTDPLYTRSGGNANFVLSTSLTGYDRTFGGVVPMREDGYSVFYNLCKEDFFILVISFKDCEKTDSLDFFQELSKSLIRMHDLLLEAKKAPMT
ncbi:putative peroxisomal carnitine O-octanoyltransferase [Apostichopus japonicus]|uniref:Putative peroxisomal carnitine O-octanoyltransferase n=1 Tax=Stichopus japonicus TaxID=307972 RepID=A0A2G8LFT4_STIJA|nr:putative peroxisomal carnitine O-octanoyltransferase [Apostichopus japonicus]